MRTITLRFDKSVASFFLLFRYLLDYSLVFVLVFIPLLFIQIQEAIEDGTIGSICSKHSYFPCFTLHSAFKKENALAFSVTMFCFLVIGLFGFMYRWTKYDRTMRENQYFGGQ